MKILSKKQFKKALNDMGFHIVNGIKYALPVIIIYSVLLALVNSNIIRTTNFDISEYAYLLIIPVLTAFIAHSITNKITLIPGLILGAVIDSWGLGFLGGIIGGLFLGYLIRCICSKIKIMNNVLNFVVGYIVLGAIGFVVTYFVVKYMVEPGVTVLLTSVNDYVSSIDTTEVILLVAILAFLTTLDLGGPFNKLSFGFVLQFYLDGFYHITGPALLAVVLPPLGVYLGLKLLPERFNEEDHKSSKFALLGALFGMTEGALQVGYRRPVKIIPILIVGSVTGSVLAAFMNLENALMVTGVIAFFGVNSILVYLLCISIGSIAMFALMILVLPKKVVDLK